MLRNFYARHLEPSAWHSGVLWHRKGALSLRGAPWAGAALGHPSETHQFASVGPLSNSNVFLAHCTNLASALEFARTPSAS